MSETNVYLITPTDLDSFERNPREVIYNKSIQAIVKHYDLKKFGESSKGEKYRNVDITLETCDEIETKQELHNYQNQSILGAVTGGLIENVSASRGVYVQNTNIHKYEFTITYNIGYLTCMIDEDGDLRLVDCEYEGLDEFEKIRDLCTEILSQYIGARLEKKKDEEEKKKASAEARRKALEKAEEESDRKFFWISTIILIVGIVVVGLAILIIR